MTMATISATLVLGSLLPPAETASAMKTSARMPMPSIRLFLTKSVTEWSLHTFCVAMVRVRSMSSTETCHMASRKTGRLSCVAFI